MAFARTISGLLVALFSCSAQASGNYPSKPIRLIVPFATGGTADLLGRLYGKHLESQLGQPVIVENRPGAAGNIGTAEVARSEPTGYTIGLVATGILAINQYVFKQMPFDAARDLVPVAPIATTPSVIFVNPGVPGTTLLEFIDFAKKNPEAIRFGSAGSGSTTHLSAAQLAQMTGIEMIHVPYKGAAPFTIDLVAGNIQMVSGPPASFLPHLRVGKLRALAVASRTRSTILPDVPTSAEAGLPGYEPSTWYAIVAPAGTPGPIVEQLNRLAVSFVDSEGGRKALDNAFLEPMKLTPSEFGAFVKSEAATMERVVSETGMKAE